MRKTALLLGILLTSQLTFISCSDDDTLELTPEDDANAVLYKAVLTTEANDVITETYQDLFNNSTSLRVAVESLTIGDEDVLVEVREAWAATRSPWEKSEGFLYGPVDSEGIDPAMDSWPVNVNDINAILSSDQEITSDLLESNNEARGFHTIEYFVWGLNGQKTAADLTARELEYLSAATQNLESKTAQLYNGWVSTGNNFGSNFVNAGVSGSIYSSQVVALTELVDGLITIADEVANGKIETPLNGNAGTAMPEAEESRFSNNSKLDFADNIRSIQNIYLGDYNDVNGKGLTDVVAPLNATLDAELKAAITAAIDAVISIPGTFTEAIQTNRTAVEAAQVKVRTLQTILETDLKPLITGL